MFKPVPNQVDFVKQEHEILEFWEKNETFNQLRLMRSDAPRWSFIDGPITANNPMGIHHGWGRTYKDLFHRYYAMKGYKTRYQNGFDCQGLWVEVNVERDKGFKTKRDIEKYGLADFVLLCKQRVLNYAAVQTQQSIRLGYWMDWNDPDMLQMLREKLGEDPGQTLTVDGPNGPVTGTVEELVGKLGLPELGGSYFTFSDENNYTIWQMLKSCFDRDWVYKGRDVMPWCARCGTGLSQHEIVTEGYQELTHASIVLRFPLRDRPGENLLVWTTTPWTLTSNVAAAVGPDLEYVRARQGDEVYYLSKGTLHMLKGEYVVEETVKGSDMEGWMYEGPFDEFPAQQESGSIENHRVILWDEVGDEEGTGIVHIAPGCGAEDFLLSKDYDLPVIAPLDEAGVYLKGFDWLTGMQVHDVAELIFKNLDEKKRTYRVDNYTHRYPVCWRCGDELVFRLVDEWFISMGEQLDKTYEEVTEEEKQKNLRYQIMEVVRNETNWYPSFGKDRELDWLRNMHDWMISKKRYWGLALPIWECEQCKHFEVIGSKEELKEKAIEGWNEFEGHSPHRPYIDAVKVKCPSCGSMMSRIPDVGNPWLDAGIVGMSTLQYRTDRAYWEKWFPANLISESFPGQFRNWFYSLLAMSTILERKAPFKDIFTYGTLLAEDGRAMHKSWGNAIEFNEAADKMGVDVMRWLYCDQKPEKDLLFGYHRADEARRQVLIPLWNIYSFFITYANIDGWKPDKNVTPDYSELDLWILARINELIAEVNDRLDKYEPHMAAAAISRFVDHLSNWYLRRSRSRFWAKAGSSERSDADKNAAYATLYSVLTTLVRMLAPFMPFVTEVMYQNLILAVDKSAAKSVHHTEWPNVDEAMVNTGLTGEMELILRLVSLGHAARNKSGIKVRQPLAEAAFAVGTSNERDIVDRSRSLLSDELNVKNIRLLDSGAEVVSYTLNPLPKQLGQKYGAAFPGLRKAILEMDSQKAADDLLSGVSLQVTLDGEHYEIQPDEVQVRVEAREGFSAASEAGYVVALDTELTEELINEGLAREVVRRIQDLRKKADLKIDDHIEVVYQASERLEAAIQQNIEYIKGETLSVIFTTNSELYEDDDSEHKFDGETLKISLTPAS
ncbi:MAG: isoleucine--tRNA ligase [Anaerolineales bacterium]|nr:isoleucine--tRNA ligase [Anaerolineales bacterium]